MRCFLVLSSELNSSDVFAYVEIKGLIGAVNNPMFGMIVAVAVAVEEASK